MKLSTKGRYAMVALTDIALQSGETLVTLGDISKRQDISLPYLEQLFVKLRRAKLVESVRGPGGGYRLANAPSEIRVLDVLAAYNFFTVREWDGGAPIINNHEHSHLEWFTHQQACDLSNLALPEAYRNLLSAALA